ncbi:hypothetical protein [Sphingomonas sp.]|jgi:hypothetical protein|uniref:hypothetical protein n=1 Tax=Sphingomonas sp. TaxID=28214 RepID=UPI00307D4F7C
MKMARSRYVPFLLIVLVAGSYAALSIATGFDVQQKAWLDANPAVAIGIRIAVILFLVGGGIAWLIEPDRKADGRPTRRSRFWCFVAFGLAGAQTAALLFGNPFK